MRKKILVTGGYGYIGSHTVVELHEANYEVVIIDNLSNTTSKVGDSIRLISNTDHKFIEEDLTNGRALHDIFLEELPDAVIHFAGLKSVSDSIQEPLDYYSNNVVGTLNLLSSMEKIKCTDLIFSSSATVYGNPGKLPISEDHVLKPLNPYGQSKCFCEQMITDWVHASSSRSAVSLRYFNPIGAHDSFLIGDNPSSGSNNLMPIIVDVAAGRSKELSIFGSDYPTIDGTAVRDYIHVLDLANAHVLALKYTETDSHLILNLGTGKGHSVLEVVEAFEAVNAVKVEHTFKDRRHGDAAKIFANVSKAELKLGWRARLDIYDMCSSAWQFGTKFYNRN